MKKKLLIILFMLCLAAASLAGCITSEKGTYTVSFAPGHSSVTGAMADVEFARGEEKALPENTYTREAYVFDGWAITAGGEKLYTAGQTVKNLAEKGGSVTLYALWLRDETKTVIEYRYEGETKERTVADKGGKFPMPSFTVQGDYAETGWYSADHKYYDADVTLEVNDLVVTLSVTEKGFTVQDNEITGYTGDKVVVTLPGYYNKKPVFSVGEEAFKANDSIEVVIFSSPIKVIKPSAFSGCTKLSEVVLSDSVETVGEKAFYECKVLDTLSLDSAGLKEIGDYAFFGCEALTEVLVPQNVKTIGLGAFGFKQSLNISGTTRSLYNNTAKLKKITLPFIGGGTADTAYMAHIFGGGKDDNFYDPDGVDVEGYGDEGLGITMRVLAPVALETIVITGEDTAIGDDAFSFCLYVRNFEFTAAITEIGDLAFYNCIFAAKFIGLDDVTDVGEGAFMYVPLKEMPFQKIEYIGAYAFAATDMLDIILPETIEYIGEMAFYYIESIRNVTILRDFDYEFYAGSQIFHSQREVDGGYEDYVPEVKIWVPDGVGSNKPYLNYRKSYAWQDYGARIFPISEYGKTGYIFDGPDVIIGYIGTGGERELVLPQAKRIEIASFTYLPSLEKVKLPEGLETIGNRAFFHSIELSSINFPSTLLEIGDYAFTGYFLALKLDKVILPDGFKRLGEGAFMFAYNILTVRLPASIEYIGYLSFGAASKLENFYIFAETPPEVGSYVTAEGLDYSIFSYVNAGSFKILVPSGTYSDGEHAGRSFYEVYRETTGFSGFAEYIKALPGSEEVGFFGNSEIQIELDGSGSLYFYINDSYLTKEPIIGKYTLNGENITMTIPDIGTLTGTYAYRMLSFTYNGKDYVISEPMTFYDDYLWANLRLFDDGVGYFDMYGSFATKFTYTLDNDTEVFTMTIDGNNLDPENSEYAGTYTYIGTTKDGSVAIDFWLNDWLMEFEFDRVRPIEFTDTMSGTYVGKTYGMSITFYTNGDCLFVMGSKYDATYTIDGTLITVQMYGELYLYFEILPNGDLYGTVFEINDVFEKAPEDTEGE